MQLSSASLQSKLTQPAVSSQLTPLTVSSLSDSIELYTVELSNMDLLKQVDSSYLNKKTIRQIENDDVLLEVRVFDQHKSKARSYLDHRLCTDSTEEAMRSVADEVKPLIEEYRVLFVDKLPPGLL